MFLSGRKDENGWSIDRGVIGIRGSKATEEMMTIERLQEARCERH
jgi:hypothetical protein